MVKIFVFKKSKAKSFKIHYEKTAGKMTLILRDTCRFSEIRKQI